MRLTLPDPEVHARATSSVSVELIDARLLALSTREDRAADQERAYLRDLRAKLTNGDAPSEV